LILEIENLGCAVGTAIEGESLFEFDLEVLDKETQEIKL